MAASGMSDNDNPGKIELLVCRDEAEVVNAFAHIQVGTGPSAAGLGETPIFNIPCRDTLSFQSIGHRREGAERGKVCFPTTSMYQNHHGVGPGTRRYP